MRRSMSRRKHCLRSLGGPGFMLMLLLGGAWQPGVAAAASDMSSTKADPTTDWPVMISRLRQQTYEQPGLASVRHQLAIAYNNYGVSLGNEGKWSQATEQLEEAMRLDEGNAEFRNNLGTMYLNQAQLAYQHHQATDALSLLEKSLALKSTSAPAYALRGEIEYQRQKLKEARTAWQRSLELDPIQPELKRRLEQVTQELPVESKFERTTQAYFDLRYEEQIERSTGFDLRDALLEARREVGSDFAYWPKQKIVVLIYSAASFKALRQETPDWVAGQFDGKIRVPLPNAQLNPATVRQILFHEYTHALIHDLANDKCPLWLNEGLAEYEGRTQNPGSLALLLKASASQQLFPIEELSNHISTALRAEEVGLAYQQSYSMVAYLVNRYGFWRIRHLLKRFGDGEPWQSALSDELHMKLSRLSANWQEWLPELLRNAR